MQTYLTGRSPLLSARLHRPSTCSDVVKRSRLFEQLEDNLENPLTLIVAPAGFGKTTLITSWLDSILPPSTDAQVAVPYRVAWLSADPTDNTPQAFFGVMIAAIEKAFPESCVDAERLLQTAEPQVWGHFIDVLSRICLALPDRLVLVIDDYYLVTNETVHEVMSVLLRNWNRNVHTIIATRTIPPLPLAQLRARRQLVEIRSHDLQFDRDETAQFVRAATATEMPPTLLDTLQTHIEGWAAGVRLAVLSLKQRMDVNAFIHDFQRNSNRYIIDYLFVEVLQDQPADLQAFLLQTALLPRMCSRLCAAVTQQFDEAACQAMLEQLEAHNLFVVNLDDHRGWFRYHHQFQTVLLNRLRLQIGDAGIQALRQRAAEWLATNSYPDEAIAEYAALEKFERAAEVIENHLIALENDEQWPRLLRWLAFIPDAILHTRPGLLIAMGWIKRFQFANAEVTALAAHAEKLLLSASEVEQSRWLAQALALKTQAQGSVSSPKHIIALAGQVRQQARREEIWVRAYALQSEALAHKYSGDLDTAISLFDKALHDPDFNNGKSLARIHLGASTVYYLEGDLPSVCWHARHCLDLSLQHHMPMTAAWGHALLGMTDFYSNRLANSEAHLRALMDMRFMANWQPISVGAHALLCILVERGDFAGAQGVIDAMRELEAASRNQASTQISNALDATLNLYRGDLNAAASWAHVSLSGATKRMRLNDIEWEILVKVLVAQDTPESLTQAGAILEALLQRSKLTFNRLAQHEILVWTARLLLAQGRRAEALEALAEAVVYAQPRGLVRWFTSSGDAVQEMLIQLARSGRHAPAARALLDQQPFVAQTQPKAITPSNDIDRLTQREAEVLELLAAKMTNKEIAIKLAISPITVRNHSHRIYAKLQVSTRRQAVQKAKTHGLIP